MSGDTKPGGSMLSTKDWINQTPPTFGGSNQQSAAYMPTRSGNDLCIALEGHENCGVFANEHYRHQRVKLLQSGNEVLNVHCLYSSSSTTGAQNVSSASNRTSHSHCRGVELAWFAPMLPKLAWATCSADVAFYGHGTHPALAGPAGSKAPAFVRGLKLPQLHIALAHVGSAHRDI